MRRRLFTILSALSLVLCAATCVLWMRSYRRTDALIVPLSSVPDTRRHLTPFGWVDEFHVKINTRLTFASTSGALYIEWRRSTRLGDIGPTRWVVAPASPDRWAAITERATGRWRVAGLAWARRDGAQAYRQLRVPFWMIAGVANVLPAVWLWRRRARGRRDARGTTRAPAPAATTSAPRPPGAQSAGRRRRRAGCDGRPPTESPVASRATLT